ncbi:bestrophin-1 domain protein [Oesophagostomum dentatum]|uniref:Bestrophin homolog n=1 Tax=Oesophagostomum dentatum TaxID=61180 RepID=A0A0B1TA74_OESDE|nr:bestrophin-1 domain protein [Oesophagostomum dentatum]
MYITEEFIPTNAHILGFMTEPERDKYSEYNNKLKEIRCTPHFLPIQWCYTLLFEARTAGKLSCDLMLNEIVKVVFLAVRSYFFLCLIARQSVLIDGEPPQDASPLYPLVPFSMTALQFVFYVGWMKVAESLMNPLGEDDDDFECNYLIDRNLRVGLTIVDDCYGDLPLQQKDSFWGVGFMTEPERDKYSEYNNKLKEIRCTPHFLPIQWCYTLLFEARTAGKLSCDLMLNEIVKHIGDFRRGLAQLANFDWVPIPLVYPQVVFLAVRSYFFLCLIARQSVLIDGEPPQDASPLYPLVPFSMTALQFVFYVGWMKVAESLMNPLGEDDDDFECNYLIDRNLRVGLTIVDDCYGDLPLQQKDSFWGVDTIEPLYSADSAVKPVNPQVGSAAHYELEQDEVVMMPHIAGEDFDDVSLDDAEARLLPRGVSVVSVNRHCGSRASLSSRKSVLDTIRKQFSR